MISGSLSCCCWHGKYQRVNSLGPTLLTQSSLATDHSLRRLFSYPWMAQIWDKNKRKHKLQLQFPWLSYSQKTLFTYWNLFPFIDFVFEQNSILKDLVTGIFPKQNQCWSPECTFHPFLVPALHWKGSLRNHVIFVLVKGKSHCCARRAHSSKLEFNDT